MPLKEELKWSGLGRKEWIDKIDLTLGLNCHIIQNQGLDHLDRERDETKREAIIRDARLRILGELTEIIWQMKEGDADEILIEQTDDLQYYILSCDITDREVRMQIQHHVSVMHDSA